MIALLIAGAFSLVFTLFLTPVFIKLFTRIGWGQFIRDDGVAGGQLGHHTKRGTPTMGGIVFLVGAFLGYLVGHLVAAQPWTMVGVLVFGMAFGLGLVGFIDDFTKTRKQRSLGIGGWTKIAGQVIVGTVFAVFAITENFRDENNLTPASTYISGVRDINWLNLAAFGTVIGFVLFVIWINVITTSTSNAVNVTDGLDGLAAGASIFAIGAYIFIGFWQANQSCFNMNVIGSPEFYKCYEVRDPMDLAVAAAALCGALIGFLWWNTSPAQIFMGDTGSMGLGGALAALAILSRTELLLVLIAGLFIITTSSVILQRAWFKITKRRYGEGRRIFLMSPLHHHFELKGWAEVTVVVRFWIIAALFVAAGVGLFYLEWVSR